MNLLFVWDGNYSGLERNVGYLLTSKFDVKFDVCEKKLLISPNTQYICLLYTSDAADEL